MSRELTTFSAAATVLTTADFWEATKTGPGGAADFLPVATEISETAPSSVACATEKVKGGPDSAAQMSGAAGVYPWTTQ